MKSFKFKQFEIQQSKEVFRVGTDAVLLGSLLNVDNANSALEIGSGTGIVSLMLAQRNPNIQITAIDVNVDAVNLAQTNFQNSPFAERLNVVESDFNNFISKEKFDLIFSNPPYFEAEESKDLVARHQVLLSFSQLISKSVEMLTQNGKLAVIIPSEASAEFIGIAAKYGLNLIRQVDIFGIKNGKLKRNILEFSKEEKELKIEEFVIEKDVRVNSEQYREATKDFHPMF